MNQSVWTQIFGAVQGSNVLKLRQLLSSLSTLERDIYLNGYWDHRTGQTLLHCAVYGDLDITRCLLQEFFADPNRFDQQNNTPLHLACKIKRYSLVRLLLHYGAKDHFTNVYHQRCFDVMTNNNNNNNNSNPPSLNIITDYERMKMRRIIYQLKIRYKKVYKITNVLFKDFNMVLDELEHLNENTSVKELIKLSLKCIDQKLMYDYLPEKLQILWKSDDNDNNDDSGGNSGIDQYQMNKFMDEWIKKFENQCKIQTIKDFSLAAFEDWPIIMGCYLPSMEEDGILIQGDNNHDNSIDEDIQQRLIQEHKKMDENNNNNNINEDMIIELENEYGLNVLPSVIEFAIEKMIQYFNEKTMDDIMRLKPETNILTLLMNINSKSLQNRYQLEDPSMAKSGNNNNQNNNQNNNDSGDLSGRSVADKRGRKKHHHKKHHHHRNAGNDAGSLMRSADNHHHTNGDAMNEDEKPQTIKQFEQYFLSLELTMLEQLSHLSAQSWKKISENIPVELCNQLRRIVNLHSQLNTPVIPLDSSSSVNETTSLIKQPNELSNDEEEGGGGKENGGLGNEEEEEGEGDGDTTTNRSKSNGGNDENQDEGNNNEDNTNIITKDNQDDQKINGIQSGVNMNDETNPVFHSTLFSIPNKNKPEKTTTNVKQNEIITSVHITDKLIHIFSNQRKIYVWDQILNKCIIHFDLNEELDKLDQAQSDNKDGINSWSMIQKQRGYQNKKKPCQITRVEFLKELGSQSSVTSDSCDYYFHFRRAVLGDNRGRLSVWIFHSRHLNQRGRCQKWFQNHNGPVSSISVTQSGISPKQPESTIISTGIKDGRMVKRCIEEESENDGQKQKDDQSSEKNNEDSNKYQKEKLPVIIDISQLNDPIECSIRDSLWLDCDSNKPSMLVISTDNGSIGRINSKRMSIEQWTHLPFSRNIHCLCMDLSRKLMFFGYGEHSIGVLSVDDESDSEGMLKYLGSLDERMAHHSSAVTDLTMLGNDLLLSSGEDRTLRVWLVKFVVSSSLSKNDLRREMPDARTLETYELLRIPTEFVIRRMQLMIPSQNDSNADDSSDDGNNKGEDPNDSASSLKGTVYLSGNGSSLLELSLAVIKQTLSTQSEVACQRRELFIKHEERIRMEMEKKEQELKEKLAKEAASKKGKSGGGGDSKKKGKKKK